MLLPQKMPSILYISYNGSLKTYYIFYLKNALETIRFTIIFLVIASRQTANSSTFVDILVVRFWCSATFQIILVFT